jgi:hypothetical protein
MKGNQLACSKSVIAMLLSLAFAMADVAGAQVAGKFPPDSLVNVRIIPKNTPVVQVVGTMRNFSTDLGVRCQYCHVGNEGQPLDQFNFASDEKRTKLVARQMMQMVAEINRRIDSLPGRTGAALQVNCATCHRGVSRPLPLATLIAETAEAGGADSAVRVYKRLREQYFGRDAYNFGELSLSSAALRLGRARKFTEAFALLTLNEEHYPNSANMYVTRGNVSLFQGDTTAAERAFREALRREPRNGDAAGRLRAIGRPPAAPR